MPQTKKSSKQKISTKKRNKVIVALLVVLVVVAGYVLFNIFKGVNDSLADNSYTVWKTQGYDVRACRPYSTKSNVAYNGITSYVLATTPQAKNKFFKYVVEFTNTVKPSETFSQGEGLATVKIFKNPYGVNATMAAKVLTGNGSTVILPYSVPVFNIKPCPAK